MYIVRNKQYFNQHRMLGLFIRFPADGYYCFGHISGGGGEGLKYFNRRMSLFRQIEYILWERNNNSNFPTEFWVISQKTPYKYHSQSLCSSICRYTSNKNIRSKRKYKVQWIVCFMNVHLRNTGFYTLKKKLYFHKL